jgi:3-oxoacyl-[acyl-carrier-protein] synthase II
MSLRDRPVVIVGVGLVLPGASNTRELWALLSGGETALTPIDRFDPAGYAAHHAGLIDDMKLAALPRRVRKQMDRFAQLSVLAARQALTDAGLDDVPDPARAGVYVGNMFGGWQITEPSLRELCRNGYAGVSPYVATSWFPTASQGQISIDRGLKGVAKTVATDTASAAVAIGYAARAIAEGRADLMLAGGAEAPVTPYTYTFCQTSGRLTTDSYRPFTVNADGFQVGEGAVMLTLEAEGSARARGAKILGRIAGFATGHARAQHAFDAKGAHVLARVATRALGEAGIAPGDVDCVALDAQGTSAADAAEAAALGNLFAGRPPACTTAKPATGHLLGAAPAVDVLAALLAIEHDAVPGLPHHADAPAGLDVVVGAPRRQRVDTALLDARGADGTTTALVLQAA